MTPRASLARERGRSSRLGRSRASETRAKSRATRAVTEAETTNLNLRAAARRGACESGAPVADRVRALIVESKVTGGDGSERFLAPEERTSGMRVMGCASASWIEAPSTPTGRFARGARARAM